MNYYDSLKLYNAFNIEVNNTPPHPVLSFILIADYMLPPFDRVSIIINLFTLKLPNWVESSKTAMTNQIFDITITIL